MPQVTANGIDIAYESMGEGSPLLLIMGVGAQLVYWPDGFCDLLAAEGFQVIRYDSRDVGLSSKMEGKRAPNLWGLAARALVGLPCEVPYTLDDMADDAAGLLVALGIDQAHVVGVSMGGMVAQTVAIRHPGRLLSFTSMMSHPGDRRYLLSHPAAIRVLLRPAPQSRDEAMDRAEEFYRVVGSTGFPQDLEATRARAARSYDRGFYPAGFVRQMAAIVASPSRRRALGAVRVPALVIHGDGDPLIRPAGGRATARALPHARWQLIRGMGHDLPAGAWPILVAAISAHARAAEASKHGPEGPTR